MNKSELIQAFDEHLSKSSHRYYREFYCGVCDDAKKRLFVDHHVSEENGFWAFAEADDEYVAAEVQNHFLSCGMQGNLENGGGKVVYFYLILQSTVEYNYDRSGNISVYR